MLSLPNENRAACISVLFLFIIGALAAIFIPITPDEYSRYKIASGLLDGDGYDYSWPPLLVLINVVTVFLGGDLLLNRFFFLCLELLALYYVMRNHVVKIDILSYFLLPYAALVLSIASPQGLMIALIPAYVFFTTQNKLVASSIVAFIIYLLNPTCMLIFFTCGLISFLIKDFAHKRILLLSSLIALGLVQILAIYVSSTGESFMPTLTNNGPLNLLLGNNAHPLSYRGVVEDGIVEVYKSAQYISLVKDFFINHQLEFFRNLIQKLVYWFAPFDYFRSGIGGNFQYVLFCYVGFAQLVCYYVFAREFRYSTRDDMLLAIIIFSMAWLVYSIFFVKMRFRIPFDILLYIVIYCRRWKV